LLVISDARQRDPESKKSFSYLDSRFRGNDGLIGFEMVSTQRGLALVVDQILKGQLEGFSGFQTVEQRGV